jgi:hypothetical protein
MIGYCPLEEDPPVVHQLEVRRPQLEREPSGPEETECNYLVLAFILGVVVLAATDSA